MKQRDKYRARDRRTIYYYPINAGPRDVNIVEEVLEGAISYHRRRQRGHGHVFGLDLDLDLDLNAAGGGATARQISQKEQNSSVRGQPFRCQLVRTDA